MGTLVAGIKDIFSTAKTTGTNVMLSGNDGTPDGHITMANLASVLGVIKNKGYGTNWNIDNLSDEGIYEFNEISSSSYTGTKPSGVSGLSFLLNIMYYSNYRLQYLVVSGNGKGVYFRFCNNGTGGTWYKITAPEFLLQYTDLNSLASAMGFETKVTIKKHYLDVNTSETITTGATQCGFMIYSTTGEYIPIPYYVPFNTAIGNQGAYIKRETAGGTVTVTAGAGWFSFVTFIWTGNTL